MFKKDDFLRFILKNPEHEHRAYVNSAVRFHHSFTTKQRIEVAKQVGYNVFPFPAEMTAGDYLSDSGTTTPTIEQLAESLKNDEAYGTNDGYHKLLKQFENVLGVNFLEYKKGLLMHWWEKVLVLAKLLLKKLHLFNKEEWEPYLMHQCRAAEHLLFTQIGKGHTGLIIPNNSHFDTTRANIETNNIEALDIPVPSENFSPESLEYRFKGNMDIVALKTLLKEKGDRVPLVYCTITNNTNAGQPVSLENLQAIRKLCDEYKKPFFLDACRFAENSWLIKQYEPGYSKKTPKAIAREIFSLCDGFTISLKKDGLSNMGGGLFVKKESELTKNYPNILGDLRVQQIVTEGHSSYGGMSGRDIMIATLGLETVITEEYLRYRITQVQKTGEYAKQLGLPVIEPFGGHAIYFDVKKFMEGTGAKPEDFSGIAITALLLTMGPRMCELGAFAFGKYDPKTGIETSPPFDYIRMAIPRLKYEMEDIYYALDCLKHIHNNRDTLPRAVPVFGRDLPLRHMMARFELKERK